MCTIVKGRKGLFKKSKAGIRLKGEKGGTKDRCFANKISDGVENRVGSSK